MAGKVGGCRKVSKKDKGSYAVYRNQNRRLRNKIRRIERHIKRHSSTVPFMRNSNTVGFMSVCNDKQAHKALARLSCPVEES